MALAEITLVTGGAGFIGSHLVDRLVQAGGSVRVLDSIEPQVHGQGPGHRNSHAEYLVGSVTDPGIVRDALSGATNVVHLAAQVGVGQSMYDIVRYVRENTLGTAVLLEALADVRDRVGSLVVASSMSLYGEGRYDCPGCATQNVVAQRRLGDLAERRWEPSCPRCDGELRAMPTSEDKPLQVGSVYAVTKRDHEELCLVFGRAYGIRSVALRFFNAYGPRQSLSNPYTGVAAIFASRLLSGAVPMIFEDGLQSRDFVHVSDITQGIELALATPQARDVVVNLGTGVATTVDQVARTLATELGLEVAPERNGRFRQGDIRHCFADISRARTLLGYAPQVAFQDGMRELTGWIVDSAPPAQDGTARATQELMQRGLVV